MTKRHFTQDSLRARRKGYNQLDELGEAQQAFWGMIESLKEQGLDIGPRAEKMLEKRAEVKRRAPKE